MAELLSTYCRIQHLIFIETGRAEGKDVYWFKRYDGQRLYRSADQIRSGLRARA